MLEFLYKEWNNKINVISRKDIENLTVHHLLHSLVIGLFLRFSPGTQILDAGTGGGLPGIPLAILFPGSSFTLVDSVGKKILVVSEIGKALGLTNIRPLNARAETLTGSFDFITGRAVTDLKKFVKMTRQMISGVNRNEISNGILYLTGGETDPWIHQRYPRSTAVPLKRFFDISYFESKKLIYIPLV